MEPNDNNESKITRKRFLQICGTLIGGLSIAGISGLLLRNKAIVPDVPEGGVQASRRQEFVSPYRQMASLRLPGAVEAFELADGRMMVATPNNLLVYDTEGKLLNSFAIGSGLRDMAVANQKIYLLFPTRVEVYDCEGNWLYEWEACSELSDYCFLALAPGAVFITDAALKNVCKYTDDGQFVKFIQSPNGFIIPSYSFGITYANGLLYCSNPGRHQVELYTTDGEYKGAFGEAGGAAGKFCGCCNPVHLTVTATGDILASEKGNPRISCYGSDGEFRSLLIDARALGGGNAAYEVKAQDDKLFVAGKDKITTFQYDKALAMHTACSKCKAHCPLRKGITI